MPQVTTTAKGFTLRDEPQFKGSILNLQIGYEVTAIAGPPNSAPYFDKFVAYFAQEAAKNWNSAKVAAEKALAGDFDKVDKECMKKMQSLQKSGASPEELKKALDQLEGEHAAKLSTKMQKLIMNKVGNDFVEKAHSATEKRILKEGTKLKKSKVKIAIKVVKFVLKVAAIAAAAVATVASGGAATPVLVAVAAWVAFGTGTAKKLVEGAKIIESLHNDARKDVDTMEKMLAELDEKFAKCVKFANSLSDKADAIEMQEDKVVTEVVNLEKSLSKVNPNSPKHAKLAQSIEQKRSAALKMIKSRAGGRAYAAPLRDAFTGFRKVKNDADWGNKMANTKSVAAALKDVGSAFEGFAKVVAGDA